MSRPLRIGVQVQPHHVDYADLRTAWRTVEELGADTIFTWDHFFPLFGDPAGKHFEAWTLLAAMAEVTKRAEIGVLVSANSYRNPQLLADMARTVDHVAGGRVILGLGAGWAERDYEEYGYEYGTWGTRLAELERALPQVAHRRERLSPPPVRDPMPLLIGGGGENVLLRLVAEHADIWNGVGKPDEIARKNSVLDDWCRRVGRDPAAIERSVLFPTDEASQVPNAYVDAGATHLIVSLLGPDFDYDRMRDLIAWRDDRQTA